MSDIDVNRHVTTRRYIDLITDIWTLDKYIDNRVSRFEIAFKHEARYGQESETLMLPNKTVEGAYDVEIRVDDTACALARITFIPRNVIAQ